MILQSKSISKWFRLNIFLIKNLIENIHDMRDLIDCVVWWVLF